MAKKTQTLIFRLTPAERRLFDRAAKIERRTVSDFVRLAANEKADKLIKAEKKRKKSK